MDEEARLAADAHSTRPRARWNLSRLAWRRSGGVSMNHSDERNDSARRDGGARQRRTTCQLTVFAKLIDMRGVDWSVEDARWMAEEWTREARKLESYLE